MRSVFFFTEILERLAPQLGLLDAPSYRKRHIGRIPLVGGLAVFLSISVASLTTGSSLFSPVLLAVCAVLVVAGSLDDVLNLSALLRLIFQITLASILVVAGDVRIESVGSIVDGQPLVLDGFTSTVFTVMCMVGVINAINMIDGLDGLAGSVLLISYGALALMAYQTDSQHLTALLCVVAALAVFLCYNSRLFLPRARVFLGDSGSMFLGLMLTYFFIELSQGDQTVMSPVSAGWMLGLPLLDTIAVMVGRILDGKSPFSSGRDHLHHRLLNLGLNTNETVMRMVGLHLVLVAGGLFYSGMAVSDGFLEMVMFWLFVILVLGHFFICRRLISNQGRAISE